MNHDADLERVVQFYETLSEDSLSGLDRVYDEWAFFKDPFNEVQGLQNIEQIFMHMFVQTDRPRFVVTERILHGDHAFLIWDFLFRAKHSGGEEWRIHGSTHLRFGQDGLVVHHRDYWDTAEELYEKIPVLGCLMRCLKWSAKR
jgi:steroid delta-isomerase